MKVCIFNNWNAAEYL